MLRNAINEIRLHPGRIVATLVAIAISVGFIAGAVTFISTVRDATARSQSLPLSRADLVVEGSFTNTKVAFASLTSQVGVSAAQVSLSHGSMLTHGDGAAYAGMYPVPDEQLAWSSITTGRWPSGKTEVALSPQAAEQLGAKIGDTLTVDNGGVKLTVVGLTDDPPNLIGFISPAYVPRSFAAVNNAGGFTTFIVKAVPGTDVEGLRGRLAAALGKQGTEVAVKLASDVRQKTIDDMMGQFDVMRNVLLVFAAISLLVGMIIIANTFAILVAQRRQQIGLLRAVGASGAQVRRKFLVEAAVVGVLGSALGVALGIGVAAIGAWFAKSLHWGLSLPPIELAGAFAAGFITTVLAAVIPSLRATRVSPMEALQIVPPEQVTKRITLVRYIVCGLFLAGGALLTFLALTQDSQQIVWALGAGLLLSIGVLGAAPIYVPLLIRVVGRVFSFAGPTVRLATANAVRNPQRSAATATALMLAIGLIITLQIGIATTRATALEGVKNRYPVDVSLDGIGSPESVDGLTRDAEKIVGVSAAIEVVGGDIESADNSLGEYLNVVAPGADLARVAPGVRQPPPSDGQAYLAPDVMERVMKSGATLNIGGVKLTPVKSRFALAGSVVVSPATLAKVVKDRRVVAVWIKLADGADPVPTIASLQSLAKERGLFLSGSVVGSMSIEGVVNVMLLVLTALLGVAVLIALVGVANTLGLSVIERKRESALLRALGMQKAGLRGMLLVEALLIAGVGAIVGIVAGAFFGWLGTKAAYSMIPRTDGQPLVYSIDWLWTGGLLAVAIVCAALASILPGRRAANATPTEALADE